MKVCQTCRRCYGDDTARCVDSTHSPPLEEVRVPLELGGRWRIERLVSGTDWAAEFVGRHIELGRAVSIRVSTAEGPRDVWLKRARLAARSLAGVRHENIARLEDFGAIPAGGAYAAVERFGDESVREAIDRVGPLPARDAVRIGRQVADGLAALAAKAMAPPPRALLAEEIRIGRDESQAPFAIVTQFPNRDRGDPAQLVPALGGLLAEMLLGKPFTAGAFRNPEPISLGRPDLPEELAALVDRSVSRGTATAPKSIAEMAARLREIERGLENGRFAAPPSASAETAEAADSEAGPQIFFRTAPRAKPAADFPPPARPSAGDAFVPEETALPEPSRPETVAISLPPAPAIRLPETPSRQRLTPPAPVPPKSRPVPPPPPEPAVPAPAAVRPPEKRERLPPPRLDDVALGPDEEEGEDSLAEIPRRRFPGGVVSTLLVALAVATAASVWFIIETMPAYRPAAAPPPSAGARPAAEPTAQAEKPTSPPPPPTPTASPVPAASAQPTPSNPSERDVRRALDAWVASTNTRNLSEQMRCYVPRLQVFYQQRNVSRDLVRRVKSELFALGPATIQVSETDIRITSDRRAAITRFRKDYDVGGTRGRRRGAVLQELKWVHTDNGWKIVSERDAKVLE